MYIIKDFVWNMQRNHGNMLLPSTNNAFETYHLSLSVIVLSVGYSLEWNMDRRLAGKKTTKKWRFILDNGFLSLFLSASQTVCLLFLLSGTQTHTSSFSQTLSGVLAICSVIPFCRSSDGSLRPNYQWQRTLPSWTNDWRTIPASLQ